MNPNARDIVGLGIILGIGAVWAFDHWRLSAELTAAEATTTSVAEQTESLRADLASQQRLVAEQAEAITKFEAAPKTADDVLGGEAVTRIIQNAQRVEVFRLKDQEIQKQLADYEIATGPYEVDPLTAADLADTLTASSTYLRNVKVGCIPTMGMRTRFTSGESKVDVVYCFNCSILVVYLNEKRAGSGIFTGQGERYLKRIAKRMLPEDEAIQAIK